MKPILLGAAALLSLAGAAIAQPPNRPGQPPPRPAAPPPAQAAPAPAVAEPAVTPQNQARVTGWVSRCVTGARASTPECVVEQAMTLVATNQTVMAVVIRIAPENRAASMQIQVPHATYLPGGVKVRTDTGTGADLAFQMCDQRGCFTGTPITPELLTALKAAKRLEVTVQDMARAPQLLSMPMDGFTAAYEKVQ